MEMILRIKIPVGNLQKNHLLVFGLSAHFIGKRFASPMKIFTQHVQSGKLKPDPDQSNTIQMLEELYNNIQNYDPQPKRVSTLNGNLWRKFFNKVNTESIKLVNTTSPQGLYIWGSVGGGKTTLMDIFFDCCNKIKHKRRIHYNSFMSDVHARIHRVKQNQDQSDRIFNIEKPGPFDPTFPVAVSIADESWLICLDEFQVTDIADAMILKSLFTHLFNEGIICVLTSNRHPNDLYKNGLQRSNFVPFISILLNRCKIATMNAGIDYRRSTHTEFGNYYVKYEVNASDEMDQRFKYLCSQENDIVRSRIITHLGRDLTFQRACGQVLDTSFIELCDRPLSSNDYIQIAQSFHTVLIRDVPQMSLLIKSQLRRFITLIDTLYDNHVRVIISSDVRLENLFNLNSNHSSVADDQRILMDDLQISMESTNASASVFTGEEELFAFDRTLSRLYEMQKKDYSNRWSQNG